MNKRKVGLEEIRFGIFTDKKLEREYFNHEIGKSMKYIRPMLLVLGVLYLLFLLPDYYLIKNPVTYKMIVINRLTLLALVVILYRKLGYMKDYQAYSRWLTVYEMLFSISFLFIAYQYEAPDFLIQAFGVMLIILGIYIIPSRWLSMVFSSAFVSIGFFSLSLYYMPMVFIRGLLFGMTLQLAVGPVFFAVLHKSMRESIGEAFKMVLGVAVTDAFYIFISFTGIGALLKIELLKRFILIGGAGILIFFGVLYFKNAGKNRAEVENMDEVDFRPGKRSNSFLACCLNSFRYIPLTVMLLIQIITEDTALKRAAQYVS